MTETGRKTNFKFILLSLVIASATGAVYLNERGRIRSAERSARHTESGNLEARFQTEKNQLTRMLGALKTRALQTSIAELPQDVLSISTWSIPISLSGPQPPVKTSGSEIKTAWDQALNRILPAEISKRTGKGYSTVVLPLRADESLSGGETLRLALFFEPGSKVTAMAFRPNALLGADVGNGSLKRFLMDPSGLILAHPRLSETGVRANSLADLLKRQEKKADGNTDALRVASKSWEGFPSTIRFERIAGWDVFLVLEQVHAPVRAGMSTDPLVKLGMIFGGLLSVFFLFMGSPWAPRFRTGKPSLVGELHDGPITSSIRELVKTVAPPSFTPPKSGPRMGLRELRQNPPPFTPKTPITSLGNGQANPVIATESQQMGTELERFILAKNSGNEGQERSRMLRERILLEEFEENIRKPGPVAVETQLVTSCSKATKSPALFFRYEPLQGIARLTAEAGYPASHSIIGAGGMSFALPSSLIAEIHQEDARGKRRNLWDHAPLSRLMLSRLGIANFEAWPMIHRVAPSRGPSHFIGVLIVVESGVDSVLHREFLGALIERASRVSIG